LGLRFRHGNVTKSYRSKPIRWRWIGRKQTRLRKGYLPIAVASGRGPKRNIKLRQNSGRGSVLNWLSGGGREGFTRSTPSPFNACDCSQLYPLGNGDITARFSIATVLFALSPTPEEQFAGWLRGRFRPRFRCSVGVEKITGKEKVFRLQWRVQTGRVLG
jgi:hypothetical protein